MNIDQTPDAPAVMAYSYLRFSTPEQMQGDSFRRQTAMTREYVQRHGLVLDDKLTFQDLGVSAFRGKNASDGRLGDFKEAVGAGLVPKGSYLLVEGLDRLSRLEPRKALRVLEDIVDLGITVVTMSDGRAYSEASLRTDNSALLIALITFMRANEESETKSRRLQAAWGAKRATANTTPLTSRAPAWLKLNKAKGRWIVLEDRAAIVQRIFSLSAEGVGQHQIAAILNTEAVPTFGRATFWQRSYISKILTNASVIGSMTPHTLEYAENRKQRKPQEAIAGYFPAIIPADAFHNVQAALGTVHATSRGRHANAPLRNILGGLATCPKCGGTSTMVSKGKEAERYLVCAKAKTKAGCTYRSVRYGIVEDAILTRLSERLASAPAGAGAEELDTSVRNAEGTLSGINDSIENMLANPSVVLQSPALTAKLRDLEQQRDTNMQELRAALALRDAASGPLVASRIDALRKALSQALDPADLNRCLRTVFKSACVNYSDGTIDFAWQQGGDALEVPYAMPLDA
jgi:DNA invertase Pin-like site-specific DNA recombinase